MIILKCDGPSDVSPALSPEDTRRISSHTVVFIFEHRAVGKVQAVNNPDLWITGLYKFLGTYCRFGRIRCQNSAVWNLTASHYSDLCRGLSCCPQRPVAVSVWSNSACEVILLGLLDTEDAGPCPFETSVCVCRSIQRSLARSLPELPLVQGNTEWALCCTGRCQVLSGWQVASTVECLLDVAWF